MAQGICHGCGGPGVISLSGFCGPMCEDAGPSYVLDDHHPPCWSCGALVEPTGLCSTCDVEYPCPDPDEEYAHDRALVADRLGLTEEAENG